MVFKVLSIADQKFNLGFKIEKYSSHVYILIGCFNRNTKLIGYGMKIQFFVEDGWPEIMDFQERVFGGHWYEKIGYKSEVLKRRHYDISPNFEFLQTTTKHKLR